MLQNPADLAAGRAALIEYDDAIASVEPSLNRGMDLELLAISLLKVCSTIEKSGLMQRMFALDGPEWSRVHLDRLRALTLALLAILEDLKEARLGGSTAVMSLEDLEEARRLREKMLSVLDYNLGTLLANILADIRGGHGYLDLASDHGRLGGLYRIHHNVLQDDKRHYDAQDADRAEEWAVKIRAAVTSGETPEVTRLKDLAARVVALLFISYGEVARAGWFLLGHEKGAELLPPMRSLARR